MRFLSCPTPAPSPERAAPRHRRSRLATRVSLLPLAVLSSLLMACSDNAGAGDSSPGTGGGTPTPVPVAGPGGATGNSTFSPPAGYTLAWADEFDTDGLPNEAKWGWDTFMNRQGWFNNEKQYYADHRAENAHVEGGRLLITARKETLSTAPDWGGQAYTSARLLTRGKAAWTYGFFEIRAKLACGQGTWPAIWMLGTGGRWPDDGELDIMENIGGRPLNVFSTIHTAAGYGAHGFGSNQNITSPCTTFHNYQMFWTPTGIQFGIDGAMYVDYKKPSDPKGWPFDNPQFMLLNVAIGGDLGGVIDDAIFPSTMEVDYVRVYQAPR